MVAKPYVQKAVLAGRTPPGAKIQFTMAVRNDRDRTHDVLAVRFPPGVCQAEYRYLTAVTWVPTKGGR